MSVYFREEYREWSDFDMWYEEIKHRRYTLAERDYDHSTAWQVDNQEKLLFEMERDINRVLLMIHDI